jgi:nitrogen fixation protein FixH
MTPTVHPDDSHQWTLTGKHVLAMLLVFFGIIIAVSIVFTTLAVQSFRGEDIKQSYRQGIEYNETLADRAAQSDLGWRAAVNVTGDINDRRLIVKVTGADDRGLSDLTITGRLRHPADQTLDRPLVFTRGPDGLARADIAGLYGQWTVQAQAMNADGQRQFRYDLNLR